jgi:peptide/nickel transport system substrate-binding protein
MTKSIADNWVVDDKRTTYTVHLRKDLVWQDGYPLTSADVVFTYKSIQNPDANSPLATSWQNIIVTATDSLTVQFALPNTLSSFPYSMTNGIVPKHLLSGIPASQLRSVSFNTTNPVGTGPFSWGAIELRGATPETREQQIALRPNEHYHGGKPKLSKFVIRSFTNEKQLLSSFNNQELNGVAGLEETPESLKKDINIHEYNTPLLSEVMVFLKTSNEILGDVHVRQALTAATDTAKIDSSLGYPVLPARGPLLASQLGYDKTLIQTSYNFVAAQKLLDDAGWKMGANKIRLKDGKPLIFSLYSQNNKEFNTVVQLLKKQWKELGVDLQLFPQSETELQTTISFHNYDSLVFGISLGSDPDVFAYWHSTQADVRSQNRLNLSEYRSLAVDRALEAGRTRTDPSIRAAKYKPFLDAWRTDAPAIALYQPRFLYISRGQIFGYDPHSMNSGTDRYANVENWMIHENQLPKITTSSTDESL